ncbi:MAG: SRPBCC family protein [Acidimicrobiales bacterium]
MDQESIDVAAPPEQVWDLLADVTQMGRWSPECVSCTWLDGADAPSVGARFKGKNKHGFASWSTVSAVTKAERGSVLEWQVDESRMVWGYRFEPTPSGGTKVTEYRDKLADPPLYVRLVQRSGLIGRNREALMVKGMQETLVRVKAAAESS